MTQSKALTSCWSFAVALFLHFSLVQISEQNRLYENSVFGLNQRLVFNDERDVLFYHFSSNETSDEPGHLVRLDNITELENCGFDSTKPTRFLIHGWYGSLESSVNVQLLNAYRLHPDEFNLVVVDWSKVSRFIIYFKVFSYVKPVGRIIARYLDFLNENTGMSFMSITLIGHSLGAHIAGIAGKNVKRGRIQNIVGLDAALPFFMGFSSKLLPTDAEYVETIHTNIGFKGFAKPLGHASFYPNWGKVQLGCGWDLFRICSHNRVIAYFAESVASAGSFEGLECSKWEDIMDEKCIERGRATMGGEPLNGHLKAGVYYVKTNSEAPFGGIVKYN